MILAEIDLSVGVLSAAVTGILGLIGAVIKLQFDLKKAQMAQKTSDTGQMMDGYASLFAELKGQISELKSENERDRRNCEERINLIDFRHKKEIDELKEFNSIETRALRFRVTSLEAELERYKEKEHQGELPFI